jgi:predicted dehydrogenase
MTFTSYLDDSKVMENVSSPVLAPDPERPLRVLVRGTGSIGARHLRVLDAMGVQELFAWPVRPGTTLAQRPDIPESAQLVDCYPPGQFDLVVIATDTSRHVVDTLEALEHAPGALLLEKPVAPTAAAAAEILNHPLAGIISVSAPLRFHQGFALTADVMPRLGPATSAQVSSQSWLPSWRPERDYRSSYSARKEDGGALRDLVHDIDYPVLLFGAPDQVSARLGYGILGIEAEEAADILWETGAMVHLRLDYVTPVKTRSVRISSERGAITWDVVRNEVTLQWSDSTSGNSAASTAAFPADANVDTILARQSRAVLERSGRLGSHVMGIFQPATLRDGILAVAICDAARASSGSLQAEKVVL